MIGIIGGSGFYNFTENMENKAVSTPFGNVMVEIGSLEGKDIFFLPRHGKSHSIPPSQINYRANIYAAHKLEANALLATNAVGSIRTEIEPGTFATPDHLIDFTSGREYTYFDGSGFSVVTNTGKKLEGVVHVDVSVLFDPKVCQVIRDSANKLAIIIRKGGTIVATNGPRFETPSEIKAFAVMGGDYVGMTSSPEVFLAKELEIPYATLAVITNYAAGLQSSVTAKEVFDLFKDRIELVKEIFKEAIIKL